MNKAIFVRCVITAAVLSLFVSPAHAGKVGKKKAPIRTCDQYSAEVLHNKARPYNAIITQASKNHKVDTNLIRAVITVETCFRTRARSHKGARGLMQLMPATARRFGVTNRHDLGQNINAGTEYLSYLLRRYNNSLRHAIMAYNAGEGRVDRYGLAVPFKETQGYMRKVMNAYVKFRSRPDLARAYANDIDAKILAKYKATGKMDMGGASGKLPSCMTASKKLHKATYHRDKNKTRTFFYKVKDGDSLDRIRRTTGASVNTVRRLNSLRRNLIKPGQKLKVSQCNLG